MTTLTTSRTLPATAAALFDALQDPARLARWWGPVGFSSTFALFEWVAGGRWVFTMHGPDGKDYPNEAVFHSIEPGRRVVIQHLSAPRFVLTVTLTETAAGTRVDWEQAFEDAAVGAALRPICEPANAQNLDRWAAEVQAHGALQPRA